MKKRLSTYLITVYAVGLTLYTPHYWFLVTWDFEMSESKCRLSLLLWIVSTDVEKADTVNKKALEIYPQITVHQETWGSPGPGPKVIKNHQNWSSTSELYPLFPSSQWLACLSLKRQSSGNVCLVFVNFSRCLLKRRDESALSRSRRHF